ncbi:MAG: hypothetical protein SF162_06155 [bacterium]|nr:hypothetical protein [bacterium]
MLNPRLIVLCSLFCLVVSAPTHTGAAQTPPPLPPDPDPILLWVRGDLWQVDPLDLARPAVQITQNGTISAPAIMGSAVAYKAAAPVGLEALDRVQTDGDVADFDLPADLYVISQVNGTFATAAPRQIIGQPPNASLFVAGVPDAAVIRSAPAWSPDGLALAWTEIAFGTAQASLVILDGRTGEGVQLPTELPVDGIPPRVTWGNGGLMVWLTGTGGETWVGFYSTTGALLWRHLIPPATSALEDAVWLEAGDRSLPALLYSDGAWWVFDPLTEPPRPLDALPRLTSRQSPADSFRVSFGTLADTGFFWEAFDPFTPEAASVAFPGGPSRVTLSPSGRAIAFLGFPEFGAAAIYRDGDLYPIPGTGEGADELNVGAILWGTTVWSLPD